MQPLDELLSIKRFREQQADAGLQVARGILSEAHRGEQQREHALAEFRDYARIEEDTLYRQVINRRVKVNDIFRLHEDLAILRAAEAQHEADLQNARSVREDAQKRHIEAQGTAREARTTREKFTELVTRHHAGVAKEAERREELEFEELAGIVREREQWSEEPDV
jgi:type III secretion protein O